MEKLKEEIYGKQTIVIREPRKYTDPRKSKLRLLTDSLPSVLVLKGRQSQYKCNERKIYNMQH